MVLSSDVIPLVGVLLLLHVHDDRSLARIRSTGDKRNILQHRLTSMVVNTVCFLIENKAVIKHTAFTESAGQSGRILMGLVLFQLTGCHTGILMHQQECRPCRQLAVGHQDNLNAVHHADPPGLQHLLRRIAVTNKGRILHQQVAVMIGAESITVINRHIAVAHVFNTVEQHCVGICLRNLSRGVVPVVNGRKRHGSETVPVISRNNYLTQFTSKALARVADKFTLHIVATVNHKAEALILGDLQGLDIPAQVIRVAVTIHTAACIVIQRCVRDRIDYKGLVAFIFKGIAGYQCRLGFRNPAFVYFSEIFGCKIHSTCHSLKNLHKIKFVLI